MKRLPLFTIREYVSFGMRTLRPALRVLAWSFNATCSNYVSAPAKMCNQQFLEGLRIRGLGV